MDLTIEEHLKALVRLGATFAGYANLAKWNDNSKGSLAHFALDMFDEDGELKLTESPFKGCLEGVKDGQRFYLVAIMAAEKQEEIKPRTFAGSAKLLAMDEDFWRFSDENTSTKDWPFLERPQDAEVCIEQWCGVTSCSEIIEGTEAGRKFKQLQAQFLQWRET